MWNPQYPLLLGLAVMICSAVFTISSCWGQAAPLAEHIRDNLSRPLPKPQELQLAGDRTIELRFGPVPGRGLVNVVLDRTERKGLEQALVHSQK